MSALPEREDSETDKSPDDDSKALYLIASMADTTWRMFVPTIGLLLIGDHFDKIYGTKPWLMLTGASVGAVIATLLIKRLLNKGR